MAGKLENVWETIKNNNFHTVGEIADELLCLLCKKLLINAHSAPCGCRFCLNCISEYLATENKTCPGETEECQIELINMNENIIIDRPMNVKISKLIVKCPERACEYIGELRKMEDHTRICNYRAVECPYSDIGCDKYEISHHNVVDHLRSDTLIHTKLLLDFVGNLNNEMSIMKANNNELREENKLLRTEINELKLDGEKRQKENVELECKLNKKIRDIDELNADMICLKIDVVTVNENVDKLIVNGEKKQIEFANLQQESSNSTRDILLLNQGIEALRNTNIYASEEVDGLKEAIQKSDVESLRQKKQIEQIISKCQIIENRIKDENQQRKNKEKDLIKNIEEMGKKKEIGLLEMSKKWESNCKMLRDELNDYKLKVGENQGAIQEFEIKSQQQDKKIDQFDSKYNQMELKFHLVNEQRVDVKGDIRKFSKKIEESVQKFNEKLLQIETNQNKKINCVFMWKIDNFSDKMEDARNGITRSIHSKSFFTHKVGYKMRLKVYPDGDDEDESTLPVYFSLMKGVFDDILEWPFKHSVTFALIDQRTRMDHVSKTLSSDDYLSNETLDNYFMYGIDLISLDELSSNPDLMMNNQIFIKCTVNDQ